MPLAITLHDNTYFTEEFKNIVRSCKEILLDNSSEYSMLDRTFLYAHRNNFYAYLRGCGFSEELIWPIAFINDITDPTKGFENKKILRTVTIDVIDSIILPLRTNHN